MSALDRRTSALIGWAFGVPDEGRRPFDPQWRRASWRRDTWTSDDGVIPTATGMVLAWNAETPPGAGLAFSASARIDGEWSPWTPAGEWGCVPPVRQSEGPVRREIDVLSWVGRADAVRLRARRTPNDAGKLPRLRRVVVACDRPAEAESCPGPSREGPFVQPIPFRSQMAEAPQIADRICGPTSLAMHLAVREPDVLTADIAAAAFDSVHDIYGNWARLAAVAGERGLVAWIERFACLADVENRLLAGYAAILSVAYEQGELEGSPVARTDGHLLVLRGWDADGSAVCNDPAFPDRRGDGVAYPRSQFQRAWANHGGATILLRPVAGE